MPDVIFPVPPINHDINRQAAEMRNEGGEVLVCYIISIVLYLYVYVIILCLYILFICDPSAPSVLPPPQGPSPVPQLAQPLHDPRVGQVVLAVDANPHT